MERLSPLSLSARAWVAAGGVALVAALYHPLELDDLPHGLRADGLGPSILWSVVGALWVWSVVQLDVTWPWFLRHRAALVAAARYGGLYYGLILVALFYAMYAGARLSLGFWPPKTMAYDPAGIVGSAIVHMLICGWFWYWPVALLIPLVRLYRAVARRTESPRHSLAELAVTLLFAAYAYVWLKTDPHNLVTWFLD